MFDLEQAIAVWRQQMLAAGIQSPAPLEELVSHLREEIERQLKNQIIASQAFENAAATVGSSQALKTEFRKIRFEHGNFPLFSAAWALFAVSFFLLSYGDGYGWQCAGLSFQAWTWHETLHGDWNDIHLACLSLANIWMLAAPFLLWHLVSHARHLFVLRLVSFLALALTWSFLISLHAGWNDLRIGAYVWAASFLVLNLSLFVPSNLRKKYA